MVSFKRFSLLLCGLLLTVFLAACSNPMSSNTTTTGNTTAGSNTSATNNNAKTTGYGNTSTMAKPTTPATTMGNNKMATPVTTVGTQNNNKMATPAPTMGNQNTMSNANALIHTTQVTLNGKMITILTNAKGLVLYYKLNDPQNQSSCTGACATDWPPVLATNMNMMTVTSTIQLPHKLAVVKTANGNQVTYDGHVLYTYAGDMTPGQFSGRAMDNVWYLVSLGL
jgi:predicted lipoprotein with Yx(FWY)xxD motif